MLRQGHLHEVFLSGTITHSWRLIVLLMLSVTFWEERGAKRGTGWGGEKAIWEKEGWQILGWAPSLAGSWCRRIPLSLRGWCPGWPRDLPQALSHWLCLRQCQRCLGRAGSALRWLLCKLSPSRVPSGQPDTTLGRTGEGQSRPPLVTPGGRSTQLGGKAGLKKTLSNREGKVLKLLCNTGEHRWYKITVYLRIGAHSKAFFTSALHDIYKLNCIKHLGDPWLHWIHTFHHSHLSLPLPT